MKRLCNLAPLVRLLGAQTKACASLAEQKLLPMAFLRGDCQSSAIPILCTGPMVMPMPMPSKKPAKAGSHAKEPAPGPMSMQTDDGAATGCVPLILVRVCVTAFSESQDSIAARRMRFCSMWARSRDNVVLVHLYAELGSSQLQL